MRALRVNIPPITVWLLALLVVWLVLGVKDRKSEVFAIEYESVDIEGGVVEAPGLEFDLPYDSDYKKRREFAFENPLFLESRRRPQPTDTPEEEALASIDPQPQPQNVNNAQVEARPVPPALAFLGYMVSDKEIRVLLSLEDNAEEQWVTVGDKVMDWAVAEVSEKAIRIRQGEYEHIVEKSQ